MLKSETIFNGIDKSFTALEKALLVVSAASLTAIAVIIFYGIFARALLWHPIADDVIFVQQLMLVSIVCGLSYVTGQSGHIAIDIFYDLFSPLGKRVCFLVAALAGLIAFVPVTYWAFVNLAKAYEDGTFFYGQLQLPEWPAKLIFALGMLLMCLRLLLLLVSKPSGTKTSSDAQSSHHEQVGGEY